MALNLIYLTNQPAVARIAEANTVNWIMVDLEKHGKKERQHGTNSVLSEHEITDIGKIKEALTSAHVLVRVNPIFTGSQNEINAVIEQGAEMVMLPYFKSKEEVETFLACVKGRAKTMLLLETREAVEAIDEILALSGIDSMYIGLNDLHISYKKTFLFESLVDGLAEELVDKFRKQGLPYGIGGIASLDGGLIPGKMILTEDVRLGVTYAILSRAFCDTGKESNIQVIENQFESGVAALRKYEAALKDQDDCHFVENRKEVERRVKEIVKEKKN